MFMKSDIVLCFMGAALAASTPGGLIKLAQCLLMQMTPLHKRLKREGQQERMVIRRANFQRLADRLLTELDTLTPELRAVAEYHILPMLAHFPVMDHQVQICN